MIKLNLKSPLGNFLVEGNTQLEVFEAIAAIQEVFTESCCGVCGSNNIRYVVRENGGNKFPEIHCQELSCFARLAFGQNKGAKAGWLFPNRKLAPNGKPDRKKGEHGDHRGWSKFKGDPDNDD